MTAGEQGRVVPAYALTRGRAGAGERALPLEAMVCATTRGEAALSRLRYERRAAVALAATPVAIAEVASHLDVPLGVARVLVSDLAEEGLLALHLPVVAIDPSGAADPEPELIERLLGGLRAV
jgi:hypothetical protein